MTHMHMIRPSLYIRVHSIHAPYIYTQEQHTRRLRDLVARQCLTVVKALQAHKCAYPFNEPVDLAKYKDYTSVVRYPMDLGTIRCVCCG